jgi:hypothetical protein
MENEWIKCSDRLPAIREDVLVWCRFRRVAYYDGNGMWSCFEDEKTNSVPYVTHWQPLPGRPKDSDNDKQTYSF